MQSCSSGSAHYGLWRKDSSCQALIWGGFRAALLLYLELALQFRVLRTTRLSPVVWCYGLERANARGLF